MTAPTTSRMANLGHPSDDPNLSRVHTIDLALLGVGERNTSARVLDAGCGAGRHELALASLPVDAVACDLDRESLYRGRYFVGEGAGRAVRVAWVQAHGIRLPFADGTFDAVICSETLEHVRDDMGLLRELRRVTRPRGRIAVSVPAYWPELLLWALSWRVTHTPGGHLRIYRREHLLKKLRTCGWRPYAVRRRHAFESVYWVLGALFGGGEPPPLPARAWRRLVNGRPAGLIDRCERAFAPLGKSLVVYARAG
ncbi:MAG: class I SAM-dependent methyltransferase [Dehalococcoidia bacterium]